MNLKNECLASSITYPYQYYDVEVSFDIEKEVWEKIQKKAFKKFPKEEHRKKRFSYFFKQISKAIINK